MHSFINVEHIINININNIGQINNSKKSKGIFTKNGSDSDDQWFSLQNQSNYEKACVNSFIKESNTSSNIYQMENVLLDSNNKNTNERWNAQTNNICKKPIVCIKNYTNENSDLRCSEFLEYNKIEIQNIRNAEKDGREISDYITTPGGDGYETDDDDEWF